MPAAVPIAKFFAILVMWGTPSPVAWRVVEAQTLSDCQQLVKALKRNDLGNPTCKAIVAPKKKERIGETTPADLERIKVMGVKWAGKDELNKICNDTKCWVPE